MTPHPSVTHVTTKQDLSRFARAHADASVITWSVRPGLGGTLVITEHDGARPAPDPVPQSAAAA